VVGGEEEAEGIWVRRGVGDVATRDGILVAGQVQIVPGGAAHLFGQVAEAQPAPAVQAAEGQREVAGRQAGVRGQREAGANAQVGRQREHTRRVWLVLYETL